MLNNGSSGSFHSFCSRPRDFFRFNKGNLKKKQQSKELKKLQREPISSSNENVNDKKLKAPIEESFRFFDNANFRYKHFRNSLGYKMNF